MYNFWQMNYQKGREPVTITVKKNKTVKTYIGTYILHTNKTITID